MLLIIQARSIEVARIEVRAMYGSVTTGAPTAAKPEVGGMVHLADVNLARSALYLRVALQAKVVVALNKHLVVDGTVRIVADGASFAHGFVLEDEQACLVAMTLRAGLIQA